MKKLTILSIILIYLSLAMNVQATLLRTMSMYAELMVPDKEVDTLYINPAFIMDFDGLEIYSFNVFMMDSELEEEENYETMMGTNIASYRKTESSGKYINSAYGVLGTINDMFGIGALYTPFVDSYESLETEKSNASWPDHDRKTEIRYNWNGTTSLNGILGLNLNLIKLGLDIDYENIDYHGSRTLKTNGVEDISWRSKSESFSSTININFGALYDISDMKIGTTIVYGSSSGENKNNIFYIADSDFYVGQEDHERSTIGANLLFQKPMLNETLLRIIMMTRIINAEYINKYDEDNVNETFGPGSYDFLYENIKQETTQDMTDIDFFASLVNQIGKDKTGFIGIMVSYFGVNEIDTMDDDTDQNPVTDNQEYTETLDWSDIVFGIATGIEGNVLPKIILRGGIGTSIVSFGSEEFSRTDQWDTKNNALSETVTRTYKNNSSRYFGNIEMYAGAGIILVEKLLIDITAGLDILGYSIYSYEEEGSTWRDASALSEKNKTDSTSFNLVAAITYQL